MPVDQEEEVEVEIAPEAEAQVEAEPEVEPEPEAEPEPEVQQVHEEEGMWHGQSVHLSPAGHLALHRIENLVNIHAAKHILPDKSNY